MIAGIVVEVPGAPQVAHVDPFGRVRFPGGWMLTAGVQPAGRPLLLAADQPASARRQRMQGGQPVVLSAFEAAGLRLSTEAWGFAWADLDGATPPPAGVAAWIAVQAVVFNSSDDPLAGCFCWRIDPAEATTPPLRLAYLDGAFMVNGAPGPVLLPTPTAHPAPGLAAHDLLIAPWEEAEFLAFCPLYPPDGGRLSIRPARTEGRPPSRISYGRLKARVMRDT